MDDHGETSLAEAVFMVERDYFERDLERFLVSLATPVEARRERAIETVKRLGAIGERLRAEGVL